MSTLSLFSVLLSPKNYTVKLARSTNRSKRVFSKTTIIANAYGWPVTKLRLLKMSSSIMICRQVSMLLARNANAKSLKKAAVSTRQNGDHGARTNTELTRTRPVGPVEHDDYDRNLARFVNSVCVEFPELFSRRLGQSLLQVNLT